MKYSEVSLGSIIKFPNSQIVWRTSNGTETVLFDEPLFGLIPKVVDTLPDWSTVEYAGTDPYGKDDFGFASNAMAAFRFSTGQSIPSEPIFQFYSGRAFSIPSDFGPITENMYFNDKGKLNLTSIRTLYGDGDGANGEYRIYLNSKDKTFWLKMILDQGTYFMVTSLSAYRDNSYLFDLPNLYTGTSNPIYRTQGGPANYNYSYNFYLSLINFPYLYEGRYRTSFGGDTFFKLGFALFNNLLNDKATYLFSGEYYNNVILASTALSGNSIDKARFENWIGETEVDESNVVDEDDPYIDGGTSEEGGGGGNFSDSSDSVDPDALPTFGVLGTGFATIFSPTRDQLKNLSNLFWNRTIFDALQNNLENITDMFTSLAIVPFEVPISRTVEVNWFFLETGIFLNLAAQQYIEFNMGDINLANDRRIFTSGSALDYSPFSSFGIFLPFIGYQDLDIDECRGSTINLKYRIDILSGTCVAIISLNGNSIYQFTGNCLSQIPITSENMQSLITDAVNVGVAVVAARSASGAVSAAENQWSAASTAGEISSAETQVAHAMARRASANGALVNATANASMGMKPKFGKSGAISATASLLSVKQPYLFLTTPRQSIPENYRKYCGFPSNITGRLGDFSGYTVIEDIRLNNLVATAPEVTEIYELLKSGVII